MEKKLVRVNIVDNDIDYRGMEDGHDRIMDTYILVDPNEEKLKELQRRLDHRFESGEFQNYCDIDDYITENFEVLDIAEFIDIEW